MAASYPEIARRAGHRCEYCRAPEELTNFRFSVDHVVPRAAAPELLAGWGTVPTTVDEMRAAVRPTRNDGTPIERLPSEDALEGRPAATVLGYRDREGRDRRFSVRAAPVRDSADRVRGAVAVWHDVTDLYEAATELGQLDGALKTVRRVMHELGNALAPARGYSELLPSATAESAAEYVAEISESIDRGTTILDRLGKIVRFEQVELGGEMMLDLDEAGTEAPTNPSGDGREPR